MLNFLAAVDASTLETAASHIEKNTNTYLILFAALGPLLALVGAALFVVRYIMPLWQAEQKATRDQREQAAEQTRLHIREDREATRAVADEQHKRIVESLGGRVDRLHEDVRTLGRRTGEIAVKLGLPLLLLLCAGCALTLAEQVRLRQLADRSAADCRAQPVRCQAALACARSAETAAKAIQDAQAARAKSAPASNPDARAAGLYAAATNVCSIGGWR